MPTEPLESQRPWYRQFWPWFVAFPPAAAVVGGLITLWLAGTGPALVVDDYGQIGKVTAERAARDQRAAELGLQARLTIAGAAGGADSTVTVELSRVDTAGEFAGLVVLRAVHPTRADLDAEALLSGSRGRYAGRIMRRPGRLYLHLTDVDRTWRLVGELPPQAAQLTLEPAPVATRN